MSPYFLDRVRAAQARILPRAKNNPPDCFLNALFESRLLLQDFFAAPAAPVHRKNGGDDGIRTHDPLLAGQVLSQLSYTPV